MGSNASCSDSSASTGCSKERLLIEDGAILHDNLKRELVTDDELMVAVHKQGLLELSDVKRAVLETDGNISVFARTPTADEARQSEMMDRLGRIEGQLAALIAQNGGAP